MKKAVRMNILPHLILKAALAVIVAAVTSFAMDIDYVGSLDDGLHAPTSIAVSEGQIAVLEPFAKQIKVFSAGGLILHKINLTGPAIGLQRLNDDLYLFCDQTLHQVIAVDLSLNSQGEYLSDHAPFEDPIDICITPGRILVLDAGTARVVAFERSGKYLGSFSVVDASGQPMIYPSSLTFDETNSLIYVMDQVTSVVGIYRTDGLYMRQFGSYGGGTSQVTRGGKIIAGQDGNIYISDRFQGRVVVFTNDGEFVGNIDLAEQPFQHLAVPTGLAIDRTGLLYVASTESASIHIFHVQKGTSTEGAYHVSHVYPQPFDTVGVRNIRLVAEVEMTGLIDNATGVDFELFLGDDFGSPFASIENNPSAVVPDDNSRAVVSEWRPDKPRPAERLYSWRVRARSESAESEWSPMRSFYIAALPVRFDLQQNFPNPFNPDTKITFTLPAASHAELSIFNMLGQQVRILVAEELPSGEHSVDWNGRTDDGLDAASGVYFYRLIAGEQTQTRKMVLLK